MPLTLPGSPTNGWLVLIGGGEFSFGETEEIDRFLVEMMPAGQKRIAFVPAASGSTDYAHHLGEYFRGIDSSLELVNVPIYRHRDGRRAKNLAPLREAGMIYLGGGVTNHLLAALRNEPASAEILAALHRATVVAAIGAAASAAGEFARDMQRPGSAIPALGWLPGCAIEAGFDRQHDDRLRRLMSIPDVALGIGIPPKTAVAIAPDRTATILGDGEVAVVRRPDRG
jgi:cyanophycinase-like exopeptidase